MSNLAIRAKGLGKRYRIGVQAERSDTLVGSMLNMLSAPMSALRDLRRLSRFEDEERDDILWALRDVSFEMKQGEVLGIIGRNGSGKSTLLKILSRIVEPSAGYVDMHGRVASLLEVGTGFHPELTGRENIYLNGTILGMNRREVARKFDVIVDFSGIERFIDTPVKRYSSGMKVRLAFAVAAHLEPEILVVDEVLAVGDAEFQAKCLSKMEDVSTGEGRTVLFVSHDLGAIRNLCPRALLLEQGRVVMDGTTPDVLERYLSSGQTGARGTTWSAEEAPGSDGISLRAVRVANAAGSTLAALTNTEDIRVEVEYVIECQTQTSKGLRVSFGLQTSKGISVLETSDLDDEENQAARGEGLNVAVCTIPGGLLNKGQYVLNVALDVPQVKAVAGPISLSFSISEMLFNQMRYSQRGFPRGIIHPRLSWQTENCAPQSPRSIEALA